MIRTKATGAARAVVRNRNVRVIVGAAVLTGVLAVMTGDVHRVAYLAVVCALMATVVLKWIMVAVMRRAQSELALDDAMTDNQMSLAAERMLWLSILLPRGGYAYDRPLWLLGAWGVVSLWVIETDSRVVRSLWQEGLFPRWRTGGDAYLSLGQSERATVAAERQADATEQLARTAENVATSGDAARSATANERTADAAEALIQTGHDAGLEEGRAEDRSKEGDTHA